MAMERQTSFLDLPDELLLHVVSLSSDGHKGKQFTSRIIKLSFVCRKLRDLILSYPSLWRIISSSMVQQELILAHVDRSRDQPLHIDVSDANGHLSNAPIALLSSVEGETTRWLSFTLLLHEGRWWNLESTDSIIDKYLQHQNVEKLETLRVGFNHLGDDHAMHFFNRWRMPNLRNLELVNLVPAVVQTLPQLRKLSITFQEDALGVALQIADLQAFLASVTALEEFSLSFIDNESILNGIEVNHVASIPQIDTLNVVIKDSHPDTYSIILSAFKFPNLRNLSLFIQCDYYTKLCDDELVPQMAVRAFSACRSLMSPYTISLSIFGYDLPPEPMLLPPIENFKNMKNFTLETNINLHSPLPEVSVLGTTTCPPIDTICLRNCIALGPEWLRNFKNRFESKKKWSSLRSLTVEGCPLLPPASLTYIIPSAKLKYSRNASAVSPMIEGVRLNTVNARRGDKRFQFDFFSEGIFHTNHRGEAFLAGMVWFDTESDFSDDDDYIDYNSDLFYESK